MISDDQLLLLTEAVDGELSAEQHRALQRLLDSSIEARALLTKMQSDSNRLRALPVITPPADLQARILSKLPIIVTRPTPQRQRRRVSLSWSHLAIAASVMLAVAASSFWFFLRNDTQPDTAANTPPPQEPERGAGAANLAHAQPIEVAPLPSIPVRREQPNDVAVDAPRRPVIETIPPPRPVSNVVASPLVPETPPFDLVQVRLPFLVSFLDLDRDDSRKKLMAELGRDTASRIDVFVKDTGRASEMFLASAKAIGLTVHTDAIAAERIKRHTPSSFVVYTESLTATELRDLFARISTDDAKQPQRSFDSIHVNTVQATDQKELKDVLGFDPGPWKRNATPAPVDPKPISAGTADAVAKSVSGIKPEKRAVLMTHGPAVARTMPALSKELKHYVEKRGERKPNAVPVMIVIRSAG